MTELIHKAALGHLMRVGNRASSPVANHEKGKRVPPATKKIPPAVKALTAPREAAVAWGERQGLITKGKPWPDEKLARRKKEQAVVGTTGALIGLGALAAKGGKGALTKLKPSSRTAQIASHLDTATSQALVVGAGVGGLGGLNGAAISRQEANRVKVKKGASMTTSAFGVDHGDELSKARADQRIRAARRSAASGAVPDTLKLDLGAGRPAFKPKPVEAAAKTVVRAAKGIPHGKLAALTAGGAVTGSGLALGVAHHRNKTRIGKSAFGVEHEVEKALNPLKGLGAVRTATADVGRAFGRGAATAGAKSAIRPRAVSVGLAASTNPAQKAAFHAGGATKNFTAGFSRKPPTPEAKAIGTHITAATSTKPGAFKAGKMVRQYGVPAAVVGTGAYAGTKLANRKHGIGKSAFGVDDDRLEKGLRSAAKEAYAGYHVGRASDSSVKLAGMHGIDVPSDIANPLKGTSRVSRIGGHIGRYNGTYAHNTGVGLGIGVGASVAAEKRKKAKKTPVAKADRRFKPGETQSNPYYFARHSEGAATLRARASKVRELPKGAAIRAGLRVTTIGKSAFGVEHELGKSIGYDSEEKRHRRAGVTAGVLGTGAAGLAVGSAHQARAAVSTGKKAQAAFSVATKGRDAAKVREGARVAGKLVRASTVHGARAAGLATGAAGLAATAGAVVRHNSTKGRSYNGWYS